MVRVAEGPVLWQDNGLRCLKTNLVSGRVKPISNWLCNAVEATTSASIQWIPLIICIWIIVSWVLVFCLLIITCSIDVCMFGYKIVCNCMIKCFFYSSLPFLFVCMFYVWFSSFCDDHQFIDVSIWENSSWSWWRFRCLACLGSDPAFQSSLLGL